MKYTLITVLILFLTFTGLAQKTETVVRTASMEPNIMVNDRLVINRNYYISNSVKRFDVVLVERGDPSDSFKVVARVIALEGETVTIRNNKVFIDGKPLDEPFMTIPCGKEGDGLPCANFGPFKVPEGEFFLLADNRAESQDSRLWNPHTVARSRVIGKVVRIISNRKVV